MANQEDKKEQILKAAIDTIIDHGLESFSIRRLCNKSKLSIGLVYHHFADKDEIISSVLTYYGIDLLSWLAKEVESVKGDREKLIKKITNGFNVHKKYLSLIIIISNYFTRSFYSKKEKTLTANLLASYRSTLVKIINDGVSSGSFKIDNPDALAILILGSTLGVNFQAAIDDTIDSNAIAEIMVDMALMYVNIS